MNKLLFILPGNEKLGHLIQKVGNFETGILEQRKFPDNELYLRIISDVTGKDVIVLCTLADPDPKLTLLYFLSKALRDSGVRTITLIAPYLAYMRQDKAFKKGEVITSKYAGMFLSQIFDKIITIDPHLHRMKHMSEIYSIPCTVLHAASNLSDWIKQNVSNPLLIGPDEESRQWVEEIATRSQIEFLILTKERKGDREVTITVPEIGNYKEHTPVLVDDIISTAKTMIQTTRILSEKGMKRPVCIGVHGIFANGAYEELLHERVKAIVTCNTIPHSSNGIDLSGLIVSSGI
jgi:ribose-phosphate pyrophosphokinase